MAISLKSLREALGGYEPVPNKEKAFVAKHPVKVVDPLKAPQSNTVSTDSRSGEKSYTDRNGERSIPNQGSSDVTAHFSKTIVPTELPGGRERKGDLKRVKTSPSAVGESNQFAVISDDVHFFSEDIEAASFADSEVKGSNKVYLCKVLSVK